MPKSNIQVKAIIGVGQVITIEEKFLTDIKKLNIKIAI